MKQLVIGILAIISLDTYGQIRGNNLMEMQLGNVPGGEPSDLITHYNRLNLFYSYKKLTGFIRYEHFVSPDQEKGYHNLSQYRLAYRNKGLELKIGNFNETLGNGILLRSYEIPGSVFEDQAYRIKQGFYRDLKGLMAAYNHKYFKIKILRARSLLNVLPPVFDEKERRPDLSEALQLETNIIKKQNIGLLILRNHNRGNREDFGSVFMRGSLFRGFSYNFEFARQFDDPSIFRTNDKSSWGYYGSLNYSIGTFGLSLEWKDYQNIIIGSGISDPPTLIREQSYKVLNRSIHVPVLIDESGFQAEAYYGLNDGSLLTINYAWTKNELFKDFIFQEYFIEYETSTGNIDLLRIFLDYSKDPFLLENSRYSGGLLAESLLNDKIGGTLQLEYQYFERDLSEKQTVNNFVFLSSLYAPSQWSIGVNLEVSTDPFQTSLVREGTGDDIRYWPGITGTWNMNKDNKLTFFAGQRRGGPACTSGICYEVLDFEGIELRLTTKF